MLLVSYIADKAGLTSNGGVGGRGSARHFLPILLCLLFVLSCPLLAEELEGRYYELNIDEANAADAINRLAEQTGAVLLFPYELARSRTSNHVKGMYQLMDALHVILKGSGLEASLSKKGVIKISLLSGKEKTEDKSMTESKTNKGLIAAITASFLTIFSGAEAAATESIPARTTGLEEIVVTAQKREQSVNDIGMSINAVQGEQLIRQGIAQVEDLTKIIPGLTVQQTAYGVPVYTMRGIGFFETSLAAPPAVSVYTDEIPLPYSAMTRLAIFDVERVEALKGPQGTLFGQNATGGAINYIASKPTESFEAATNISLARFGKFDGDAYLSGPMSQTLKGRIAFKTAHGGKWQESYSRNDELGDADLNQFRGTLEWDPTDNFSAVLSSTYWKDQSDTVAPQLIAVTPAVPAAILPGLANYPLAPENPRDADWTPAIDLKRDDDFSQYSLRADYDMGDVGTLTSITSYSDFNAHQVSDNDGTTYDDPTTLTTGEIESFFQEIRLSGDRDNLNWIVGLNYTKDDIQDQITPYVPDASNTTVFGISFDYSRNAATTNAETKAIFGNIEYRLANDLKVYGGARYTKDKRDFKGCTYDVDGGISGIFTILQAAITGSADPLPVGACVTFNPLYIPELYTDSLDEDNVSWRTGIEWTPGGSDNLYYVSISKGYKAGSFPTAAASTYAQFIPVKQESVVAYELGAKLSLMDSAVQLNGALFYYDYTDKQLRGKLDDPVFGPLDALVTIPDSSIEGIELQVMAVPIPGLTLSASGTYLKAEVSKYVGYDSAGSFGDFSDTKIPYTPEVQLVADAEYRWNLASAMSGFVGVSLTYRSDTSAGVGEPELFDIDSYTLMDLRTGIEGNNWTAMLWARNVFDEYYWTNVTRQNDTTYRYAGMPATFGATLSYQFR